MADYTVVVDFTDLKAYTEQIKLVDLTEKQRTRNSLSNQKSMETSYQRLKSSVDRTYAANIKYQNSIDILNKARRQGIISEVEYTRTLEQVSAASLRAKNSIDIFGNSVVTTKNKMSRGSMVAQQFGYQIGDFFVQVQSGQNVMVAFAQQGTQLAGLLPGIAGAVIGIGLAASTMIAGFIRARSGADDFDQALKRARDTAAGIVNEIDLLNSGLESATEKAFDDNIQRLRLAVEEARNAINPRLSEDSDFRRAKEEDLLAAESRLNAAEQELEAYRENIRITQEIADNEEKRIETATRNVSIAQQIRDLLREQREAVAEVNDSLLDRLQLQEVELRYGKESAEYRDTVNAMERDALALKLRLLGVEESIVQTQLNLLSQVQENTEELRTQNEVASKLSEYFDISAESAAIIARTDMASGISAAADSAMVLARNLGISLTNARNIMRLGANNGGDTIIFDPRDPRYDPEAAALGRTAQTMAGITSGGIEDSAYFNPEVPSASSGRGGSSQTDPLQQLQEQLDLQQALIGKSETQIQLINALGVGYEDVYGADTIAGITTQIELIASLTEQMERQQEVADLIANSFGDALMSVVDGTKSVSEAFKDMAANIITELYNIFVVQQITGFISGAIGNIGGGSTGGVKPQAMGGGWSNGVQFFADGGVVNSPTAFGHSGGLGVMAEAGPEAIMPLKRGADGKLGVAAQGSGGAITIEQHFHIAANGDESVKRIVRGETPRIAEAAKAAVLDAKRRGGAYGRNF